MIDVQTTVKFLDKTKVKRTNPIIWLLSFFGFDQWIDVILSSYVRFCVSLCLHVCHSSNESLVNNTHYVFVIHSICVSLPVSLCLCLSLSLSVSLSLFLSLPLSLCLSLSLSLSLSLCFSHLFYRTPPDDCFWLLLALHCYCGENVKYGFLCFQENDNMLVEKIW